MTVNIGDNALASDYNTLAGLIDDWFADGCSSCTFGDGTQMFGWGGATIPSVSQGDDMLASQMNTMVDKINIGVNIVDGVAGTLSQVSAGADIEASDYNDIESKETAIRALKNTIDVVETSIHAGTTNARTSNWTPQINCTFRFTFSDFDEARYFFNSGGALQISGTITGYSTGTGWDGAGIDEVLTEMGTVTFDYDTTVNSTANGTPASLGYYDLTTSYQQIYTHSGSSPYTENSVVIRARRSASGDYVEIQMELNCQGGRTVNGTTTATTNYRKLDDQSSGTATLTIAAPSVSVVETFE